jgi:hypothetical protein
LGHNFADETANGEADLMSISVRNKGSYILVIARAAVVDKPFLNSLIGVIAGLVDKPCALNVCVEIAAPAVELELMATMEACKHAIAVNLYRAHIACVIRGYPIDRRVTFVENYANNRGLCLRILQDRQAAVDWLDGTEKRSGQRRPDSIAA